MRAPYSTVPRRSVCCCASQMPGRRFRCAHCAVCALCGTAIHSYTRPGVSMFVLDVFFSPLISRGIYQFELVKSNDTGSSDRERERESDVRGYTQRRGARAAQLWSELLLLLLLLYCCSCCSVLTLCLCCYSSRHTHTQHKSAKTRHVRITSLRWFIRAEQSPSSYQQ